MGKFIDLTGKRFGKLTVTRRSEDHIEPNGKRVVMWECLCDCGNNCVVTGKNLRAGICKSCGCLHKHNLIGKVFGNLIVIKEGKNKKHPNGHESTTWICQCSCGSILSVETQSLISGNTSSCGCFRRLYSKEKMTIHGKYGERIYRIWSNMLRRCDYEKHVSYKNYGGRGIKVCDQWRGEHGFEDFYKWAVDNGYSDGLTIDRIDVNGNYEPDNCRWITNAEQQNNKRNNNRISYKGEVKTLAEWCRELNIEYSKTQLRLSRGWSVEESFERP